MDGANEGGGRGTGLKQLKYLQLRNGKIFVTNFVTRTNNVRVDILKWLRQTENGPEWAEETAHIPKTCRKRSSKKT
jgi:hypothetical protein